MTRITLVIFLIILALIILIALWAFTNSLQIQHIVSDANYCEQDEDCIVTNFGCPFGCGDYVNVNKVDNLKMWTSISNLFHPSNSLVECSCIPPPKKSVCSNNKCVPKQCEVGVYYSNFKFFADRECECPNGSISNITEKGMTCTGIEKEPILQPH